jgi:putative FmdB family regulatory protein
MPIYVRECTVCGHRFDSLESFDSPPERMCEIETCEGIARRIPSAVNFKLIGKGFYVNDYPKNDKGRS